jgi:hypothetical protein
MHGKLVMVVLFLQLLWAGGQVPNSEDTVKERERNFFTLGNLEVSGDGRWSAVRKRYEHQSDTLLLFDRHKPGLEITALVRLNQQFSFLKSNTLIASGNGKAIWMNLSDLKQKEYDNIRQAGSLSDQRYFFLWSKNGDVSICDDHGNIRRTIHSVQKLIADKEKQLYAVRLVNGRSELVGITAEKTMTLYRINYEIGRLEMMPSGNHMVISENSRGKSIVNLAFVDMHSGNVIEQRLEIKQDLEYMKITEILNGKAFLIDLQNKIKPDQDVVDIWYGNDGNLKAKKYGTEEYHEYFLMEVSKPELKSLDTDRFPFFASSNNPEYVLAFDPQKNFNYSTRFPLLNLYA